MKNSPPQGVAAEMAVEMARSMGLFVLEFANQQVKRTVHVHCVVHSPDMGLDRLAELHRALLPRLEVALGSELRLEMSSAGVGRTLKSFHELEAFVGKKVMFLTPDSDIWAQGSIAWARQDEVGILVGDSEQTYQPDSVHKIRLAD